MPEPIPSPILYNRVKTCFKLRQGITRKDETPSALTLPKECCEEILVLATINENTSWKNDVTSAWFKIEQPSDDGNIILYKENDIFTNYQPTVIECKNDTLARYATIDWQNVLNTDGVGCYTIKVSTTIDGVTNVVEWGNYELKVYSPYNASNTIRIKTIFNQYHSIEDIDFTLSEVKDTIRFRGFFGNRQPNMVIDNLIYQGRIEKNVQRENLNTYELNTDGLSVTYIDKLLDLYLLSETEIFITDHNEFNNSYGYKDYPLIVKDSPEVEYREYSRLASIKCKFSDKTKKYFSKYNG